VDASPKGSLSRDPDGAIVPVHQSHSTEETDMTGFFILNLIFSALVVLAIVGGLGWSIATARLESIVAVAR
jgi:hypothetical protein